MNRTLLIALFWCIFFVSVRSQSVLFNQVVSSSGSTGAQGNLRISYTIGEPVVGTLSGMVNKLTQGFHQPPPGFMVSVYDTDLAAWNIEVFPNPSDHFLNIRYAAGQNGLLELRVLDLLGRVILDGQTLQQAETRLDCSPWQPGVYFLQLRSSESAATASVRFIRI